MDLQIIKLDGTSYFLSDYGIDVKDIEVESMEYEDTFIKQDGIHGRTLVDSVFRKRKINVPCLFIADSNNEYASQRSLLYRLVQLSEPFYIRELRKARKSEYSFHDTLEGDYTLTDNKGNAYDLDNINDFVDSKRYLVKLSNVIKPTQKYFSCNVELEFETVNLPFAESIKTSKDLEKRLFDGSWSEDMNIDFEDIQKTSYTFSNVKEGKVFYHGTQPLSQYDMDCIVTIVIAQKTTSLSWTLSNGDLMYIKGIELKPNDVITYDGLRVKKNGIPITEYTGLEMPIFVYGFNKFKFNQSVRKVIFDMRFYFK